MKKLALAIGSIAAAALLVAGGVAFGSIRAASTGVQLCSGGGGKVSVGSPGCAKNETALPPLAAQGDLTALQSQITDLQSRIAALESRLGTDEATYDHRANVTDIRFDQLIWEICFINHELYQHSIGTGCG